MTNWMDQKPTWMGGKMNGHGSGGAPSHRAPKLVQCGGRCEYIAAIGGLSGVAEAG